MATVDLAKTSSRQIRAQLETKFDCLLTSRKSEIDKIVMDYVEQHNDDSEEEESSEEEIAAPPPKAKAKKRAAKESDPDSDDSTRRTRTRNQDKPKPKKRAKKEGGGGGGGGRGQGYIRPLQLSPELAGVVGADCLPRHEVVKRIWAIIKERSLYDPKNKQFAICDDQLQKVMGVKRFRTFGMMKYLKTHFRDS